MPRKRKRLGKDAKVEVLTKYLHPSRLIQSTLPNLQSNHRLPNCAVVRRETRKVNRREQVVVILHHNDFKTNDGEFEEIYAVPRWCKIVEEGPSENFFIDESEVDVSNVNNELNEGTEAPPIVNSINVRGSVVDSDIVQMRGEIHVDDDNAPAPENIPSEDLTVHSNNSIFTAWGHDGVCQRRLVEGRNTNAKLFNFGSHAGIPTILQTFEIMFPQAFLQSVIIKNTNRHLQNPVSYGEFIAWIGLWFFMATTNFGDRREFWSSKSIDAFEGTPFRMNDYMSRHRFEAILNALQITDKKSPVYKDRFWEVRQLLDEWNANMRNKFSPSWISCLDESMSKWVGKFTCPGFCCVPRKPWPLGNEYHTIACGTSGVLYSVEIVEGRDEPKEAPAKDFSELGKTVGLLLRLTRSIWGTSKVVVLDSGFCVLKGISELRKKGVFGAALIKKR